MILPRAKSYSEVPFLASDIARCNGYIGVDYCNSCHRKLANRPRRVIMMPPPVFIDRKCPAKLEISRADTSI